MRPLLLLGLALLPMGAAAQVTSETIYFLQPDGRSYLLERALRSDAASHRFHVDKSVRRDDLRHVDPQDFHWDADSRDDVNILTFDSGGFTLIFPGRFDDAQLSRNARGEFTFNSWDGGKDASGRFGMWYAPGNFDRFSYTWIVPDNIELLGYTANRRGDWVRRGNAVSFYAGDVNNLTFEIRYRVTPPSMATECPQVPAPVACAEPLPAAAPPATTTQPPTSSGGCELDCDGDGVSNRGDACPGTPAGVTVDRHGCVADRQQDHDGDGVGDASDLCPGSPRGATVDRAGCSLDTDKDGVADGIDRCPATAEGTLVDAQGCAGD